MPASNEGRGVENEYGQTINPGPGIFIRLFLMDKISVTVL
jgi:hypothetical protein